MSLAADIAAEVAVLPCGEHAACNCPDFRPKSLLIRRRDVLAILERLADEPQECHDERKRPPSALTPEGLAEHRLGR